MFYKHHSSSSENYLFYSREKLQYITLACFRRKIQNYEPAITLYLNCLGMVLRLSLTDCLYAL